MNRNANPQELANIAKAFTVQQHYVKYVMSPCDRPMSGMTSAFVTF